MSEESRRNFDKKVKMHLACAPKDGVRKEMACIYFKDGFAYATDGCILVKNRISEISTFSEEEIAALDGKMLPAEHYKDILKYDECLISDEGIEAVKGDDRAFFYFKDPGDGHFPNADRVMQDALNRRTVPMPEIGFNIKLMKRMAEALSNFDLCKAMFKGEGQPIVFQSIMEGVSSVGALMPVMIEEKEEANE